MRKLKISKSLNLSPTNLALMSDFILFCMGSLPVKDDFTVTVASTRGSNGIKTTGAYLVGRNEVLVYAKNRALVDVLRSIAHEMVHMMQDETGLIDGPVQDIGGFHEDQANAKAGELIKLYAKSMPGREKIYESIRKRKNLLL